LNLVKYNLTTGPETGVHYTASGLFSLSASVSSSEAFTPTRIYRTVNASAA
jgi:hypothetical protein